MTYNDIIYAEAAQYPGDTKIEVTLTPQGADLNKPILSYLNENRKNIEDGSIESFLALQILFLVK